MAKLFNLARMSTATTGTGTITLGAAVTGFLSFASAGVSDGDTVTYAISDGSGAEIGRGVYSSAGPTLTRSVLKSTNSGSTLNLSGTAQVFISASAEDFGSLPNTTGAYSVALVAGTNVTANRTLTLTTGDANRTLDIAAGDVSISAFAATVLDDETAADAQITLGVRETLDAARTYYVRTDGSDSNTGLANTSGGAFLTIQKAIDAVGALDLNSNVVTIQIGSGTYAEFSLKRNVGQSLVAGLLIIGDVTTPSNVTISSATTCITAGYGTSANISGLKLTSSGSYGISASDGSALEITAMNFGACSADQALCQNGGSIRVTGNYSITGNATRHVNAAVGGRFTCASKTITLTGTPAFSTAFVEAGECGVARIYFNTFSGSATGPRYIANANGVIQTFGSGATALPGNSAGSTATGGQYI